MDSVVHFEIPCDDVERAKKFYKDLFDWNIEDVPMMDYSMVQTAKTDEKGMVQKKGAINGGIMKRDETAKSPVIVINVSNVDDYLKKVEAAGGKTVMPKVPVADMGLYARVSDPEGNVIGLWQDLK